MLVVVDVFSGFVFLRALPSADADVIARELFQIICTVGPPRILQSDRDPSFTSTIIQSLHRLIGVERRLITAYHPQGDALVENTIGIIKPHLWAMLKGCMHNWPLYIAFMQLSHNMQFSSRHNMCRFTLYFARDPNLFLDYTHDPPLPINFADWRHHYDRLLSVIYPALELRIHHLHEKDIARLDKLRHHSLLRDLLPGTHVTLRRTQFLKDGSRRPSYEPTYDGRVYTVVRRTPGGAYELADDEGKPLDRRVSIDQMKPIKGYRPPRDIPNRYEVDYLIDDRIMNGKPEYLVKWKGWELADATWEPTEHIESPSLITSYRRMRNTERSVPPSSSSSSSSTPSLPSSSSSASRRS